MSCTCLIQELTAPLILSAPSTPTYSFSPSGIGHDNIKHMPHVGTDIAVFGERINDPQRLVSGMLEISDKSSLS